MRVFECVGGGSAKFWEIGRDGATVTVRFGRIGSDGQTRTTDLGTAAAAEAHVEKLISEKVGKGYVETTADGDAGSAPVRGPGSRAEPVAALPDESTFVLPALWAREAEPFRGRRPAPKLMLDVAAIRAEAEALRQRMEPLSRPLLDHPSADFELVRRAGLHRAGDQIDPLGAAVLIAALIGCPGMWWDGDRYHVLLVDDLVLAHGVVFAAETCVHVSEIDLAHKTSGTSPRSEWWIERRNPGNGGIPGAERVLVRMRAHLAAATDVDYAETITRLAALRTGPLEARMATSYLLPTEQAWVRADIATIPGAQVPSAMSIRLVASATDPADVDTVLDVSESWQLGNQPELIRSIAANLGTEATRPLATLLDKDFDAAETRRLLGTIAAIPTDEAFTALVDRLARKYVQPAVLEAMDRYPVRAARILAARTGRADAAARTCGELLRSHLISHPELVAQAAALGLEAVAAAAPAFPVADPADLPRILVTPPWENRGRAVKPAVLTGLTPPADLALRWNPGEREEWAERPVRLNGRVPSDWAGTVATVVTDWNKRYDTLAVLAVAPPELVRPHLAELTPHIGWDALPAVQRILARVGAAAAAFTLRIVRSQPTLAPALLPVEGAEVATQMADWLVRAKSVRPLARTWLQRHPDAAARDLVPAALGKPGKARTAAETALRLLDETGHRDAIRAAAAGYSAAAAAAVDSVLDADPLDRLPARLPARPVWLDPAHLPQVLLHERAAALPTAAVGHICTMLALCTPGDAYPGVEVVKAATDPASLAELAWSLLERWRGVDFPSKDGWVLEALALLGDDETVRRLAPLVRAWPGEGGHTRAVAALDVLAAIGTDAALMHLHGIAEKVKFKGLRTKAQEKITEVADGLGLSSDQLADRLVPDLGLDANGSTVLDYGPRRFTVGFDEQLKPVVADENGVRRAALPKPAAKDDPTLAPAAYAAFSGLKKDVRTIAADQIRRFEQAMVRSRRWNAAEQRALFIEHPLLWHLTRRLVWVSFDGDGAVTGSFRVAEDRTLADADDTAITLADDTSVGIAHPLHLAGQLETWSELFADYEILQPFPQLRRDTRVLTPQEREATVLDRLDGVTIATGRVLGLAHRGWERGEVMDAGFSNVMCKPVTGTHVLVLDLEPGIVAGMATEFEEQKVTGVWISNGTPGWSSGRGDRPFSELDDVTASELLRDLDYLRA